MSIAQFTVERLVGRLKGDPAYRFADRYTNRQLATALWHRGMQLLRGTALTLRGGGVHGPVFRGRRVVVEHAYSLHSGPSLILEDGASIIALSRDGIRLGRNVTIGRATILTCTGVLSRLGIGIVVGDRSAVGSGSFVGGQGGVTIGDDVIIGPGVRIFSENHRFDLLDRAIRTQGESRKGVTIGDNCWIGASVTIVDGVCIGAGCVIAAGAVVTRSIAPFTVAGGVPARTIRSRRPDVAEEMTRQPPSSADHLVARAPTTRALQEDR
ncbi:MAG: transferase hexapeptide repeat containing protein [Gemmatimonadetes bacterium]|nr:transferase hexapeptide repeat containing protein [Gemmatimonadota bacterium]